MESFKGSSNWVRVKLMEGNYPIVGSNFAFAFTSKSINNWQSSVVNSCKEKNKQ